MTVLRLLVLALLLGSPGPAVATGSSAHARPAGAATNELGLDFWEGKTVERLQAALGEPPRTERGLLPYRVEIYCGSEMHGAPEKFAVKTREGSMLPWDASVDDATPFLARRPVGKKVTVAFRVDEHGRDSAHEVWRIERKKCPR